MIPDFARSTQTNALIEALQAAPIGTVITYAALGAVINEDIQNGARHYLYSAMHAVQEDGLAFGCVRNIGVKRLAADEIPAIGDAALLHIRRSGRRARKRMAVVSSMNDVPNETRIKVNAQVSLLGVIEHFSTGRTAKKAEAAATNGTVPPMSLIDALRG